MRRRSRRKTERELAHLQRRDEALNDALRNDLLGGQGSHGIKPVDIQWDENAVNEGWEKRSRNMAELVEYSAYSRKKYTIPGDHTIHIGSSRDNQIILQRNGVEKRHCEIFITNGRFAVRNVSGAITTLERGRNVINVDTNGVFLQNEDFLLLGEAKILFRAFRE